MLQQSLSGDWQFPSVDGPPSCEYGHIRRYSPPVASAQRRIVPAPSSDRLGTWPTEVRFVDCLVVSPTPCVTA